MGSMSPSPDVWISMPDIGAARPSQHCPICGAGRIPPEGSGFDWSPETVAYSCGGAYGPPEETKTTDSYPIGDESVSKKRRRRSTVEILVRYYLGLKISAMWSHIRRSSRTEHLNTFDPKGEIEGTQWEAYRWCCSPPIGRMLAVLGQWYQVSLPDPDIGLNPPVTSLIWSASPVVLTLPYWRGALPPEVCPRCGAGVKSRNSMAMSYECKGIYFVGQTSPDRGQIPDVSPLPGSVIVAWKGLMPCHQPPLQVVLAAIERRRGDAPAVLESCTLLRASLTT
jgi:hypothetical protein